MFFSFHYAACIFLHCAFILEHQYLCIHQDPWSFKFWKFSETGLIRGKCLLSCNWRILVGLNPGFQKMSGVCLSFTKLDFSLYDSFPGKHPTNSIQKTLRAHQVSIPRVIENFFLEKVLNRMLMSLTWVIYLLSLWWWGYRYVIIQHQVGCPLPDPWVMVSLT